MVEPKSLSPPLDSEARITLGVLSAVHENDALTQRSVARELGIALGLVNAYLKRCIKKGYIKVSEVPRNRYAYYLTPQGFAEKSRLTAEFLSQSFSLFRQAREQYAALLRFCRERSWSRVVLVGAGDLAEIANLYAAAEDIEVAGIVDPVVGDSVSGLPVVNNTDALGRVDAVIITNLRDPQGAYDTLARIFPLEKVLAPRLLGIVPHRTAVKE